VNKLLENKSTKKRYFKSCHFVHLKKRKKSRMFLESKIILQIIFVIYQVFKINVDSQGFYFLKGISLLSCRFLFSIKCSLLREHFLKKENPSLVSINGCF
jgi:hypothetical protein